MEQIKGQYIMTVPASDPGSDGGVAQKVRDQISVMSAAGIDCSLVELSDSERSELWKVPEYYVPGWPDRYGWSVDLVEPDSLFLYIRRPRYFSARFVSFLRDVRARFPAILILLEVQTWPYDREFPKRAFGALVKDRWNRRRLSRWVDRVVDLFGDDELFGIPTVQIRNGTPVRDEFKRTPSGRLDEVRMVCAGNFSFWHGLDRLIAGLAVYYRSGGGREVSLSVIGGGPEVERYREQAAGLGLGDRVRFLGYMSRDEVLRSYSSYNLGVESLARHRTSDGGTNSSLKSRDYLNAGLPFFGEGTVDVLEGRSYPYYLEVPSDDSPVDIGEVIEFFDSVYSGGEQRVIDEVHAFAAATVDTPVAYGGIVRAIRTGVGARRRNESAALDSTLG